MNKTYDSWSDTRRHIARVQDLMDIAGSKLFKRALAHDESKLQSPEKDVFDRVTPRLKGLTYGSDEYKASLAEMAPALNHHYFVNDHHPEYWAPWTRPALDEGEPVEGLDGKLVEGPDGGMWRVFPSSPFGEWAFDAGDVASGAAIGRMSLIALLEMLCDWKAASERHDTGDILRSLDINKERFGISDQLDSILRNTVAEMGWAPAKTEARP